MTSAFILAAGFGTRLRPLTDHRAKPLMPIGDAPAIAHVARRLREAGCSTVVANAHHRAEEVVAFGRDHGIAVSVERDLLGTAGGLSSASSMLGEGDVLVHNGDVLVESDLGALLAAHASGGAVATLAVVATPKGTGNVGFDEAGRVVRLRRESFGEEVSGGEFTGVHVVGSALRAELPQEGCLVGDVYLPYLRNNRGKASAIHVYFATSFVDIGSPPGYLRANREWLARRREREGEDSWVGVGAVVAPSVRLEHCVVGAGARVTGEGVLARCVVWPAATAVAPLSDVVVT